MVVAGARAGQVEAEGTGILKGVSQVGRGMAKAVVEVEVKTDKRED